MDLAPAGEPGDPAWESGGATGTVGTTMARQPDDPPASDDALMAAVARGEMDSFRALSRRYLARVVALGSRTLGDPAEAEDVAQESFLRLWRTAPTWRPGEARVGTWLHRVALNLCFDRLARRREEHPGDPPDAADPAPGPSGAVQQRETADHVRAALDTLPDAQRRAITLCHYQGMRNIEAAEVMGVSIEALESLLARGRRKLREELRALAPELLGAA